MKTYSKFSLLTLSSLFALSASAQTIISSTTNNGSFEDGSGSGNGSTIDLWEPPISPATNVQEQRINNNASDETYSAVVGYKANESMATGVLLNTGYDVVSGDTFDLSFDWIPLFSWEDSDELVWSLFTTSDNTSGGTITTIASGTLTGVANGDGYQNIDLNGIGTIAGANVGQDLWIKFDKDQLAGEQFSRVDNVNLSVVPEPSVALFP